MVCSIGKPYSKLINYAEENFITKDEAIKNSRWFGRGAETLGLTNRVNSLSYDNAYQGKDDRGNVLRRKLAYKNSRSGRDLTFSAPKSVSILGLVKENRQIINAHDRAVDRALEYVEQNCIYTRTGKGGKHHQQTNNMVTAIFQHHDSRNFDPNLHSHCVIFNQTQGIDGKWRSMDNRRLYQQQMTIGAVYHHELSQQLLEQGYSLNWHRDGTFDIAGITREHLKQFGSRSAEIIDVAGVGGSSKEKAIACLSTRKTKKYVSTAERKILKDSWHDKYQQITLDSHLELKPDNSHPTPNKDLKLSPRELIGNSIEALSQNNQFSFTSAELLKESLVRSQGQYSWQVFQREIEDHSRLLPLKNNTLTTIDLYRKNRANRNHLKPPSAEQNLLKLATSVLSSEDAIAQQNKFAENSKHRFLLREISDRDRRISQSINDYLNESSNFPRSRSIILTDNKSDRQIVTDKLREKLIADNTLSDKAIQSIILKPKNLDSKSITQIENYQPGNAIKFLRSSKRFSHQHFYKILSIDERNKIMSLGDRFGNLVSLPIHRYRNREAFEIERRELRVNEKLRLDRGQYINGKQVLAGQSLIITDIKDKQRITIKINNKLSVVKTDDLFFARYDYVDTFEKYQGKRNDRCIYFPSAASSSESLKQNIYKVAHQTKAELIVYASDSFLQQKMTQNIHSEKHLYSDLANQTAPNSQTSKPTVKLAEQPENKQFLNSSPTIDNYLYELASSSKYIAINEGINSSKNVEQKVYQTSDGIKIEKDSQILSIYRDGKSIKFDRDFNLVSNEFSKSEIERLTQKTKRIRQQTQEQNRSKQIQRNTDLSL